MRLRPGSFPWLLVHDVRLNWRRFTDMFMRLSRPAALMAALIVIVGAHAIAWPVAAWLGPLGRIVDSHHSGAMVALVCVLAWMTSQGLLGGARTLIDRGNLDLLLASPLPAATVLVSRAVAIAASGFGSVAVLAMPVAHMGALLHGPGWLVLYPLLAALALVGGILGLALAVWLCLALGPRRARLVSQLGAAGIGGGFILAAQIAALLPDGMRVAASTWINTQLAQSSGKLQAVFWMPLAGLAGHLPAAVTVLAAALAIFSIGTLLLKTAFVRAATNAGSEGTATSVRFGDDASIRFRSGAARSIRVKEWRLLRRDPTAFAQLALQIIYTVPVAIILMRHGDGLPPAFALAPAIVVIGSQIAASLAWLMVSGEDAPELIAAAPLPRSFIERTKLSAIAAPIAVILAVPMLGLALLSPAIAAITLACVTAGAISTSLLNFWHPMPGNRRGMLRRHSQSKLMGLIEHFLAMLWAVVAVMAILGTFTTIVPMAAAVVIVAAFSPSMQRFGNRLRRPHRTVIEPTDATAMANPAPRRV
jgi:ABC-2 type transport system permease protein